MASEHGSQRPSAAAPLSWPCSPNQLYGDQLRLRSSAEMGGFGGRANRGNDRRPSRQGSRRLHAAAEHGRRDIGWRYVLRR